MFKFLNKHAVVFLVAILLMNTKAVKAQYEIFSHIGKMQTPKILIKANKDMIIYGAEKPLVTITYKGEVIYENEYEPNLTAKVFWESLGERRNCK